MEKIVHFIGLIAAVAMPLWNIPLILRIWKRRSSADISVAWVVGVWACIVLMLPSALLSNDFVFRAFGVVNTVFFTAVLIVVLMHRKPPRRPDNNAANSDVV